ncbi:MAG: 4a-hydroxytetrahydrobiopterin dehydratase [Acidobacteria bacterium]|nr:4a-hydroxytetrahydrobiopterin dehydratase [Acidobacteriota bacterium]
MAILTRAEAESLVRDLPGWTLHEGSIDKTFICQGFPEAAAFVMALVPDAETADHHPDIQIKYKRVTLTYTTHSAGGLTQKDFAGARMAERTFRAGDYAEPADQS